MMNSIWVDADGKIYVTGYGRGASAQDMFLCRLLPDGNPDALFGTGGSIFINVLATATLIDAGNALALSGNSIVLAGATRSTTSTTGYNMALVKLDANGAPDSTFTGNGRETYDVTASQQDYATGIAIQPDGKIVLGGYTGTTSDLCFIRLNPDGTLDNTFNTTGLTKIDVLGLSKNDVTFVMLSQPDGKIVITGNAINSSNLTQPFVARINADGSVDNTFGNANGIAVFNFSGTAGSGSFYTIQLLSDNKYLCAGQSVNGLQKDVLLVRLNSNGQIDSTFNNTGFLMYDASTLSLDDDCFGMGLQSDGKIVTSGTITLTPGSTSKCFLSRVIPDISIATFTQNVNFVCEGGSIQFDGSQAVNTTQWHWEFEGGSPAISTDAAPLVTYQQHGSYQVKLITGNNTSSDTILVQGAAQILQAPPVPGAISGPVTHCYQSTAIYAIDSLQGATSYQWHVTPVSAGNIVGNGASAVFYPTTGFIGNYTIQVNSINSCGTSAPSVLNCQLTPAPIPYLLSGPGYYCTNSSGQTVTLNSSQLDVEYELYFNDIPTGNTKSGTGSALIWNNLTDIGFYSAKGNNGCIVTMAGQVYNELKDVPAQPVSPEGPTQICNSETSIFTAIAVTGAETYQWVLAPANAGQIIENGLQASINWSPSFSGTATISVIAANACGNSLLSPSLTITLFAQPNTEVSGETEVCVNHTITYQAISEPGKQYTWQVFGGTITSGIGTATIQVIWDILGVGIVNLSEISENSCINNDQLIVMVAPCTEINKPAECFDLKVYPNPVKSELYIEGLEKLSGTASVSISGLSGNKIIELRSNEMKIQRCNVDHLSDGIYLLEITTEKGRIYSQKITIKN
jgi:uncharacterized delta-60 repeat protein